MPIYDFACTNCGYQQEIMKKISAESVDSCPKCSEKTFIKQLSAPNFQLTGSGWYATDFKHASKPETKPKETEQPAVTACSANCACH